MEQRVGAEHDRGAGLHGDVHGPRALLPEGLQLKCPPAGAQKEQHLGDTKKILLEGTV